MKRGMYVGSFNPATKGHEWVINTYAPLFDKFIVAVGRNPAKSEGAFPVTERIEILEELTKHLGNVQVVNAGIKLSANLAIELGCNYLVQGIRSLADYEYQKAARYANEDIAPGVETILVIPPRHLVEVSSSFVVALFGYENGEEHVAKMVSPIVLEKLKKRKNK